MPWPNPDDYNEALQCPELSFEDAELRQGEVETTPLGLPRVASGNFASVYRMDCGGRPFAVKCFVRNVHDQHQRYAHLSQFAMTTELPHMVAFEYQLKGIFIEGQWYPIVKMDWVEGLTLDNFVRKNWSNRGEIDRITRQFSEMVITLQATGASHCDLQHGNILVKGDSVKLVDYDGMFVPAMAGLTSNELGHPNYQHVQRTEQSFRPYLDDFSAWVIYYSLFLLRLDSQFWQRHSGGEDCLLFRKADFVDPKRSRLLKEIANHQIPDVRAQYEPIMRVLTAPLTAVPMFTGHLAGPAVASINAGAFDFDDSDQAEPANNISDQSQANSSASVGGGTSLVPVVVETGLVLSSGETGLVLSSAESDLVLSGGEPGLVLSSADTGLLLGGSDLAKAAREVRHQYPKVWPNLDYYFTSVIRPGRNFSDEKLAGSVPVPTAGYTSEDLQVDATTQERLTSKKAIIKGRRHIVVRMAASDGSKHYAVKLFLHDLADRHLRYDAIHRMKKPNSARYFVPFVYEPQGIMALDQWFPVLKMLWVHGSTLEDYVLNQLNSGFVEAVEELLPKFEAMVRALSADGIAHGDLEPSNILVDQQGELKIVDYDAMYIPALASLSGCEAGFKNYQHFGRLAAHYGPYLDNYSAVQIYGMLRCLSRHAPQRFYNWASLLQHVTSQATQEMPKRDFTQKAPKWLADAAGSGQKSRSGRFDPVFDKASSKDAVENSFEAACQRLAKVLREQQRHRIDQVATLNSLLWRLY